VSRFVLDNSVVMAWYFEDEATSQHALSGILTLAREPRLGAYDAAYLELAMREGVSLATQDLGLRRAAGVCGVGLLAG